MVASGSAARARHASSWSPKRPRPPDATEGVKNAETPEDATEYRLGADCDSHSVTLTVAERRVTLRQQASSSFGTVLWDSAVALEMFVASGGGCGLSPTSFAGARVCELGSGCGVAGLCFLLRGAAVTFTDLPEVVGHCEQNVRAVMGSAALSTGSAAAPPASFVPFAWGDDARANGLAPPYDFVVGTDCVYVSTQIPPFVDTLAALSDDRTVVVVVQETRDEAVARALDEALRERFVVSSVSASTLRQVLSPPEVADHHALMVARLKSASASGRTRARDRSI